MSTAAPDPLAPTRPLSSQALREIRLDTPLRRARTCYGHLAGVAGVGLMDELLARAWLEPLPPAPGATRIHYAPTTLGINCLTRRGVDIPFFTPAKPQAFSCIDWTERRPHLGGALGRLLVSSLLESGSIEQTPGSRVVTFTAALERWLGV